MKVSIGMNLQPGPWGGGNQFAHSLARYLRDKGAEACFDLEADDLDILLLTEPDTRLQSSAYGHIEIARYQRSRNPRALAVHRINNSSEARDDPRKLFNKFRIRANRLVADHTVFVSQWLLDGYRGSGFRSAHRSVVLNGGDTGVWRPPQRRRRAGPLKIVTHHWSTNPNKGLDIYQALDAMTATPRWAGRVEFTYVGRPLDGMNLSASRCLSPLHGSALAEELGKHDLYLTASLNEAGPMHVIEGALCGLPLLYRESGALPEYCAGFGVGFTAENFERKLEEMIRTYNRWADRMKDYPHTAERMCDQYYRLFLDLIERREEVIRRRSALRRMRWRLGC